MGRNVVPLPSSVDELGCGVLHDVRPFPESFYSCDSRAAWLESNHQTFEAVMRDALIGKDCLSLDVFDTLLLRGPEAEAARFLEVSAFMLQRVEPRLEGITAEGLCLLRADAMRLTYRARPGRDGCKEGTINDVMKLLSHRLVGDESLVPVLLDAEIDYESSKLVANHALLRVAEEFRSAGGKVVLVSDMYLPANLISAISKRVSSAIPAATDRLFSSADELYSKRSGRIFEVVAQAMGVAPSRFLHVGDSFMGDVEMPRNSGWDALHFPVSAGETAARLQSLSDLVQRFRDRGVDVSSWAKV
jgi:predicted HAD superfamily hydrolase